LRIDDGDRLLWWWRKESRERCRTNWVWQNWDSDCTSEMV